MPIQMIARELYRLQQEVDRLERKIADLAFDRRGALKEQLRKTMAERDRMRKILDGNKEPPSYRQPK